MGLLVCGSFVLDDLGEWQGIYNPEESWNGFACPLFTLEICREIADVINALPDNCERIDITDDGRVFSVWLDGDDRGVTEIEPYRVAGADFFPLGSHGWVWESVGDCD